MGQIEILDPRPPASRRPTSTLRREPAPQLVSLAGRTLGLLDNAKPTADLLLDELRTRLGQAVPEATFEAWRKPHASSPATFLPEIAERADVVVNALAD